MEGKLVDRFRKAVQKDENITNAYLLVHSGKHGIHLNVAEGKTGDYTARPEQPFFVASIDKVFISVLVGLLVEQEKLSYEDSIASYLDDELLEGLHRYKGQDYTDKIRVEHLLSHMSGLFGDAAKGASVLLEKLLEEPMEERHPHDMIHWAKEHLQTKFPPGQGFYYSDIGYYLLQLLIEKVTDKPYVEVLNKHLFEPLEMEDTYFIGDGEGEYPVADCYIEQVNVAQNRKLGMDDVGGRMAATTEDLLKFMKVLVGGEILDERTLNRMQRWTKYALGIHYGYGLMSFSPVPLFMPKRYQSWGHAGSTGSFLFYHPELETYFIGSLNRFRYERKGIMLMFRMIDTLWKQLKK